MTVQDLHGPDLLAAYGWDDLIAERFRPYAEQGLLPARVIVEYQHIYRVVGVLPERPFEVNEPDNETLATVAGRLRHHVARRVDYPAVGDWVAIRPNPEDARATIHGVLERKSQFTRKVAGSVVAEQVVAANVDVVLLVMALDESDFNPRRLERYLVLAHESRAAPSVVLTKSDLADDVAEKVAIARGVVGPDVPIHVVSAPRDEGYEALTVYLRPGRTVALLGSSGVGKSTIVNHLAGSELQRTREVRASDGRGRHTTTHRHLLLLPDGGLLMDTPGMRELQLWDVDEGVEETFRDIEELALTCRFPNCEHDGEPSCAILAAIEAGALTAERLQNYRKLRRELQALAARQEHQNRLFERRQTRATTRAPGKRPAPRR